MGRRTDSRREGQTVGEKDKVRGKGQVGLKMDRDGGQMTKRRREG